MDSPSCPIFQSEGIHRDLEGGRMWKFIQNQTPPPLTRNLLGRGLALTLMRFFNHDTNTDTDNG